MVYDILYGLDGKRVRRHRLSFPVNGPCYSLTLQLVSLSLSLSLSRSLAAIFLFPYKKQCAHTICELKDNTVREIWIITVNELAPVSANFLQRCQECAIA